MAAFGVGLIGQTPEMMRRFGANSSEVSAAAQLFSNRLLPLVNDLNSQLPGARFTYINTTGITITSTASLGKGSIFIRVALLRVNMQRRFSMEKQMRQ